MEAFRVAMTKMKEQIDKENEEEEKEEEAEEELGPGPFGRDG